MIHGKLTIQHSSQGVSSPRSTRQEIYIVTKENLVTGQEIEIVKEDNLVMVDSNSGKKYAAEISWKTLAMFKEMETTYSRDQNSSYKEFNFIVSCNSRSQCLDYFDNPVIADLVLSTSIICIYPEYVLQAQYISMLK